MQSSCWVCGKGKIDPCIQIRHVLVERDILTATKTPWLVRLLYAFQDPEYVYLAMEYVPGGDFRTLLNNAAGSILPEWHVLFYITEMFTAVNELHKLGYIHRDLKPEVSLYERYYLTTLLSYWCLRTSSWIPLDM